ncbi:DUF2510 domain-containing protein [Microlunatus elymi]|uniref:DUF2510 domain-containing protein n=1 Tax=Microlunatus elymi TaxID=2596828 RepID=A0A516PUW5_9ACTN|nr:DUF2510 domain-containing protein [Microlunatus elymi]QDP94952.1 DUF2510 domain-containing protein [Microlunatus elymi]
MNTPAAGWYPDPAGRPDTVRWWDGTAWTRELAAADPNPSAEGPAAQADPAQADPGSATGTETDPVRQPAESGAAVGTLLADPAASAGPDDPDPAVREPQPAGRPSARRYPPGYEPRRAPARHRNRSLVSTLIAIAAMVIAAVLVLVIVTHPHQGSDELSPPPPLSSSEQSSAANDVYYDDSTRELTAPGLKVIMPDSPYLVLGSDPAVPGILDKGALGSASVHKNYSGSSDWQAVVAAGVVDDSMIGKDLDSTTAAVFGKFVDDAFVDVEVQLKKKTAQTLTTGLPHPARVINAEAHYHVRGLPSSYDKISVMVVDLGDGRYTGWVSSRPNDSSAKLQNALQASIKTVQVTS